MSATVLLLITAPKEASCVDKSCAELHRYCLLCFADLQFDVLPCLLSSFQRHFHGGFSEPALLHNYRVRPNGKVEEGIGPVGVGRHSLLKVCGFIICSDFCAADRSGVAGIGNHAVKTGVRTLR